MERSDTRFSLVPLTLLGARKCWVLSRGPVGSMAAAKVVGDEPASVAVRPGGPGRGCGASSSVQG